MKYPIVLADGGDLMIFETPASLNYIEAIDVLDGVYEAWDADGVPVDLVFADPLGIVRAADRVGAVPEPVELAKMLKQYLAALAVDPPRRAVVIEPSETASLTELIDAALPFAVTGRPRTIRLMPWRWPRIRYRTFHDRPREFVVEWHRVTYFFDSPFVEAADEYSSTYSVVQLAKPNDFDLAGTWEGIGTRGLHLGFVAVDSVEFDKTLRRRVNPEVFDRIAMPRN